MYYSPTIISLIEVILVLVPALLGVAYVTIAERKTMASMQRRLGPNVVGQIKFHSTFKRSYSSSNNKGISELYLNRKAPIKPFEGKSVSVCKDLLSSTALNILGFPRSIERSDGARCKRFKISSLKPFPSLVKITSVRYFNTLNNNRDEFKEWLCGFIDSEGSFYIEPNNKGRSYRFNFQIVLHIDDIEVLHFIKSKLGMGEVRDRGSNAIFTIRAQQDIVELIEILSKYPLNSAALKIPPHLRT